MVDALADYLPLFINVYKSEPIEEPHYWISVRHKGGLLLEIRFIYKEIEHDVYEEDKWKGQYFIRIIKRPQSWYDSQSTEHCYSDPDVMQEIRESVVDHLEDCHLGARVD